MTDEPDFVAQFTDGLSREEKLTEAYVLAKLAAATDKEFIELIDSIVVKLGKSATDAVIAAMLNQQLEGTDDKEEILLLIALSIRCSTFSKFLSFLTVSPVASKLLQLTPAQETIDKVYNACVAAVAELKK